MGRGRDVREKKCPPGTKHAYTDRQLGIIGLKNLVDEQFLVIPSVGRPYYPSPVMRLIISNSTHRRKSANTELIILAIPGVLFSIQTMYPHPFPQYT